MPIHYTDCPVYSALTVQSTERPKQEILQLKPTFYGMSIDLVALWRKLSPIAAVKRLARWMDLRQ